MTRENKVALVVGFALVLLVGLLVSDHLSEARRQQAADLVPPEAMRSSAAAAELIDLQTTASLAAPAEAPPAVVQAPAPAPEPAVIRMPDLIEIERATAASEDPAAATARLHLVRPGESLSLISQRYYGTAKLTRDLAAFNGIGDPDSVRAGQRLKIPDAAALNGKAQAAGSGSENAGSPPPAPPATYRVLPGDTLSSIAGALLHSRGRWRELYEANRDVIHDEDTLVAGTVIRIPAPAREAGR